MDSLGVSVGTKASVVAFRRVGRIQPPVPARQPASNQLQHHGPAARQLDTSAPRRPWQPTSRGPWTGTRSTG